MVRQNFSHGITDRPI